jgi:hypothetical protein
MDFGTSKANAAEHNNEQVEKIDGEIDEALDRFGTEAPAAALLDAVQNLPDEAKVVLEYILNSEGSSFFDLGAFGEDGTEGEVAILLDLIDSLASAQTEADRKKVAHEVVEHL